MQTQNYKNHIRLVAGYHYVAFTLVLAAIICSIINLLHCCCHSTGLSAWILLILSLTVALVWFFARGFALKAQDRAIRAEETFRYYVLTGKLPDAKLALPQIIALRFASDAEFVALAKRAVDENLSAKEIKSSIKEWRGDYHRV